MSKDGFVQIGMFTEIQFNYTEMNQQLQAVLQQRCCYVKFNCIISIVVDSFPNLDRIQLTNDLCLYLQEMQMIWFSFKC